ncbi:MAG TPA: cytochrome c [Polyangiaceae bacterium]|nr:cytochrome c [Polyangiaceae bacterium]
MKQPALCGALFVASLLGLAAANGVGCAVNPRAPARGIELDEPSAPSTSSSDAGAALPARSALIAAGSEMPPSASEASPDDEMFVYSREPLAERARVVAEFPIHIHDSWWSFRASQLRITTDEARKRDARIAGAHAPAGFWDRQTAVEAVALWTVLCNECHGGRRSTDDAVEMPAPTAAWGEETGLFFGNRRAYRQLFDTVHDGGPLKANGRVGMPAWRNILSNEMIWALLYFLEYQSGGVESRFPPSLFPRRPKVLGNGAD